MQRYWDGPRSEGNHESRILRRSGTDARLVGSRDWSPLACFSLRHVWTDQRCQLPLVRSIRVPATGIMESSLERLPSNAEPSEPSLAESPSSSSTHAKQLRRRAQRN